MENYTFSPPQVATVKIDTGALKVLPTSRVLIVPSPGENRCIMVRDIICRKHGADGVLPTMKLPRLALAFVSPSGGALPNTGRAAETSQKRAVILRPLSMILPAGEHGRHLEPGQVFSSDGPDYPVVANQPLCACAVFGASQWTDATGGLTEASLTIAIRYEIMQVDGS